MARSGDPLHGEEESGCSTIEIATHGVRDGKGSTLFGRLGTGIWWGWGRLISGKPRGNATRFSFMEAWVRTRWGSMGTQARPDPLGLKSLLSMEIRNGNVFGLKAKISRARLALGSMCTFCKIWPFRQRQSDLVPSAFCFEAQRRSYCALSPEGSLYNP